MRILHIIPGDNFTEGMTYQDNYLASINASDGNDVMILSSCRTWENSEIIYTNTCDKKMNDGVRLVRKQYKKVINNYLTEKLRILEDAYQIISSFKPDVIRVLNPHNFTLPIVVKYKKNHPHVRLYVDSHQHYFNSGIGFISYWIFHKLLVGTMLKKSIKHIDKILYSEEGVKTYLKEMYSVPEPKLELYPMGGLIYEGERRASIRITKRAELGIMETDILMIHSGKLEEPKKTKNILEALKECKYENLKLVIIGSIPDSMRSVLEPLIKSDKRVTYLGWKSGDELVEYLCASDIYLQPGSASVTVKQALCCGNAVVVAQDIEGYDIFMDGTGFYATTKEELLEIFNKFCDNRSDLIKMGENSLTIAKELFDYEKLAKRLYKR
ncbi:glycosyltransferase [Clostridium algidicarnis]|uniref:glycosyltransferase n=1 Tax=Clostridium algidicarnis TaxID=37659 RepID=UPI001C0A94D6|nr:glycosyltransferase [Clostridium algidicarnis]MBU3194439.1 glycosyltransferase [Clostridium algidicarnis]